MQVKGSTRSGEYITSAVIHPKEDEKTRKDGMGCRLTELVGPHCMSE